MTRIYIDADACPVKQEVYRVAQRYHLDVVLVANSRMRVPNETWITLEIVDNDIDSADDWIVEHIQALDVIVTADILLADRCLKAGAKGIGPTGKVFSEKSIGQSVAIRDLMSELRSAGEISGGPPPITPKDRSRFLQQLDEMIQSILRQRATRG